MEKYGYAHEKFSTAIRGMATSTASLQDRIVSAYMSFHPVRADDFADNTTIRDAYIDIVNRLTAVKEDPHNLGYVQVTMNQISDVDASHLASLICDFYFIHRHYN